MKHSQVCLIISAIIISPTLYGWWPAVISGAWILLGAAYMYSERRK